MSKAVPFPRLLSQLEALSLPGTDKQERRVMIISKDKAEHRIPGEGTQLLIMMPQDCPLFLLLTEMREEIWGFVLCLFICLFVSKVYFQFLNDPI